MAWCPLLLCSPDERHSKLRRIFTDLVLPPARYLVNSCCSRQQTLWIKPTCLHATASQILGQLTSSLPIFALAKCQKVVIAWKQEFSVTCPVLLYPDTLLWQLMLLGGLGLSSNTFVTHLFCQLQLWPRPRKEFKSVMRMMLIIRMVTIQCSRHWRLKGWYRKLYKIPTSIRSDNIV